MKDICELMELENLYILLFYILFSKFKLYMMRNGFWIATLKKNCESKDKRHIKSFLGKTKLNTQKKRI